MEDCIRSSFTTQLEADDWRADCLYAAPSVFLCTQFYTEKTKVQQEKKTSFSLNEALIFSFGPRLFIFCFESAVCQQSPRLVQQKAGAEGCFTVI